MDRFLRIAPILLGFPLLLQMVLPTDLWAFSIIEEKKFNENSYVFRLEIQVYGSGKLKKGMLRISSLKVKIKNENAGSGILQVKTIRAYQQPSVFQDIETRGFCVSPAQWVTKYYRLRKEKQPLLSNSGYIEVAFQNFSIQFNPRQRKFHGPIK